MTASFKIALRVALITSAAIIIFWLIGQFTIYRYLKTEYYAAILAVSFLAAGILIARAGTTVRKPSDQNQLIELTQKELSILTQIANGKSNKEIASENFVELSTVKTHINNIYSKLGVNNRRDAIKAYSSRPEIKSTLFPSQFYLLKLGNKPFLQSQINTMKASYKSGIITGIAVGLFAISAFTFFNRLNTTSGWGIQPATIRGVSGLLTILIQAIGIYFSMSATKKAQNRVISYGQAFKAGLTVAIITALITAFCGLIYCTVINPGYADYMVNEVRKAMVASGKSSKQIADELVSVKWEFSTAGQVIQALIAQTVVGTLISLIMAIFIKTKQTS